MLLKLYSDGHHLVGTKIIKRLKIKKNVNTAEYLYKKELFNEFYNSVKELNYNFKQTLQIILDNMREILSNSKDLDLFCNYQLKCKYKLYYNRVKRFKRKVYLNKWNYFITITYDDKKHTEESFRKTLKKCLSNFHTRRKWNYIGVFEFSPKKNRLHFHAIMYIPETEMVGTFEQIKDYNTEDKKIQITNSNSFFLKKFGRNDFEPISQQSLKFGNIVNYLIKYISKSGEKFFYSRGVPSEINKFVNDDDIVSNYYDYVEKFVLFDDCIEKYIINNK